jgi:ATP-dependent DNA helicase RecQ
LVLRRSEKRETTRALKRQQVEVPDDFDRELLGRLKALRLELAKAKGAPAFTIFSDRTLIDMAVRRPTSRDELLGVYGVGLRKAEVYGDAFLEAAIETGEVYGQAHLIDVLRGSESEKIIKAKHDDLVVFARGQGRQARSWRSLVGQLFAKGFIEMRGEYRSIAVTEEGRGFLSGGGSLELRRSEKRETTRALKRQQIEVPDDFDQELLGRLKALRLELAKAKGAPAFTIFSDRTLIDMAVRQPTNQNELLSVYGVGLRKAEVYGEAFLEVTRTRGSS